MSKKKWLILVLLFAVTYLAIRQFAKTEATIEKEIVCLNEKSGAECFVTVSGTYTDYLLRKDHFNGYIDIKNVVKSSGEFIFDQNGECPFRHDEYGQPFGSLRQTNMFETMEIIENDYVLQSKR